MPLHCLKTHDPANFQHFDSRPEARDSGAPPLGEQQLITSVCSQSARAKPQPGTFTASYSRQHARSCAWPAWSTAWSCCTQRSFSKPTRRRQAPLNRRSRHTADSLAPRTRAPGSVPQTRATTGKTGGERGQHVRIGGQTHAQSPLHHARPALPTSRLPTITLPTAPPAPRALWQACAGVRER